MGHETAMAVVYEGSRRQASPRMSLRYVLLALLSKQPNTGYGVGRLLQKELSHLWDARLQQIYGELGKLQANGLIEAESIDLPNRPAKKIYSLTPSGQEELDSWLAERPAPHSHKDDLLVRLYCLERIPREVLIRRLEEQQDEYEMETRDLRRKLAQAPRTDPTQAGLLLTLEAALARAEGQAGWCTKALSWLREGEEVAEQANDVGRGTRLRAASA